MLRKIYRELVSIRKELHAIRSSMEPVPETLMSKSVSADKFEVRTNVDDKTTAECAVNINEVLDDITNRIYREEVMVEQQVKHRRNKKPSKKPILGAQAVEVIKVIASSGAGTPEDPARQVAQYWSKKGRLIHIEDPYVCDFGDESNA